MKFRQYKDFNLTIIAQEMLQRWDEQQIFQKSISQRAGSDPYVFYEGPPSANGMPGIHHVIARTIKDIFCRYKTQTGYQVKRKAGWDTHGLPVELGVEKQLGITKEDIGTKISVKDYNKACRDAVMRYTDSWNDLTRKMGYWVDMDQPYVTYKSKYIETVWWILKNFYDKDLLYKGYTVQPYSPKAGSGLSSHELNQPGCYRDVTDTTVVAQFKVDMTSCPEILKEFEHLHLLAWTTTPWTLPSNTALSVGKNISYAVVKTYNQYTFQPIEVILAENLIQKQFTGKYVLAESESDLESYKKYDKKIPYLVVKKCLGKQLEKIRYEQLLPYALPYKNSEDAFRVITADFVTTEDGTGIVHTAPTFGADDALAANNASPPVPPMLILDEEQLPVPLVNLQGRFRKEMGNLGDKYVKNEYYDVGTAPERSVDVEIAIDLKEKNKAFRVEKYVHSYPHCWRTDKPIIYYPMDSWFVRVTKVRERLSQLNKDINWKPKSTGERRFSNWLENANDWNLSRSRFWGIPIPIWCSEDGTERIVIGSVEQLKDEINMAIKKGFMRENSFEKFKVGDMSDKNYEAIDLHKNIVDDIVLVSPSGKPMKRENDLIDVWFDSGAMPYAQWHFPFENKDLIKNKSLFPADFIAEGVDQTRGWFYTLHVISGILSDSVAYKNVISNGLVLDKDGQKMSKRLGNAVNPFTTLEEYGADATRWYMISNANPWDNLKFDAEGISEVRRKFFGTLYNTYSFFSLYANIDQFKFSEPSIPLENRPELDAWILSELNTLILNANQAYSDYEPTKASREISFFVQEYLSNWYVRLCRRRFWKGDYSEDKISAYQTLHTCLVTISVLSAPIAPFYMDTLYRDLTLPLQSSHPESVHLSDFPKHEASYINHSLQRKMNKARQITSLVLSLRKKEAIKVRQPLSKIMIPVLNASEKEDIMHFSELIKAELNIKEIELLDQKSNIIVKRIKPIFKVLGPKYGQSIKKVAAIINAFSQKEIQQLEEKGQININIEDKLVSLQLSEVEIFSKDIEGCLVTSDGSLTVALDITISEELRQEGIARELVNRLQNLRKDIGLEVTDRIKVSLKSQGELEKAVESNISYVKSEILADEIIFDKEINKAIPVEFDNIETKIQIVKI